MSLGKLCSGAMPAIRKVTRQIDDALANVLEEVVTFTAKVKAIEHSPTVEVLSGLIPHGKEVVNWIDAAMDLIYGVIEGAGSLADKLAKVIGEAPTELAKNMHLAKIASVATAIGDGQRKSERIYDEVTTIKIATLAENKAYDENKAVPHK